MADLVAKTTFITSVKGKEVVVHAGDVVPAISPLAKGRKELSEPASPGSPSPRHRRSSGKK
jgi:hypothetical protein